MMDIKSSFVLCVFVLYRLLVCIPTSLIFLATPLAFNPRWRGSPGTIAAVGVSGARVVPVQWLSVDKCKLTDNTIYVTSRSCILIS